MLFKTDNLSKQFIIRELWGVKRKIIALDNVNIFVDYAKTYSLVGESGCGKTTLVKVALGVYRPDSGKIYFNGEEVDPQDINYRNKIQVVFQNPFSSVDPRYKIFYTLYEVFSVSNKKCQRKEVEEIFLSLFKEVGLKKEYLNRYPHQLSGGEIQRVCLVRALLKNPQLIFLDEPTSNLDMYTTAYILDLLINIQNKHKTSFLFISHNLKIVKKISHYIFVMYKGRIVECGPKNTIFNNPLHPYTQTLMQAMNYELKSLPNYLPSSQGCVYNTLCLQKKERVCLEDPSLREVEKDHFVACFRYI